MWSLQKLLHILPWCGRELNRLRRSDCCQGTEAPAWGSRFFHSVCASPNLAFLWRPSLTIFRLGLERTCRLHQDGCLAWSTETGRGEVRRFCGACASRVWKNISEIIAPFPPGMVAGCCTVLQEEEPDQRTPHDSVSGLLRKEEIS